jgi:hypothetical protein
MTSVPEAPGAPAVYLYRQVDRDDNTHTPHEYNYARIKILTEEGRKYADVEIPFFKEEGNIHNIKARTVRPDGSIVNFEGKAFDKTIVKAKGLKFLAKTFTLPDVHPERGTLHQARKIQPETKRGFRASLELACRAACGNRPAEE